MGPSLTTPRQGVDGRPVLASLGRPSSAWHISEEPLPEAPIVTSCMCCIRGINTRRDSYASLQLFNWRSMPPIQILCGECYILWIRAAAVGLTEDSE